MLVPITPTLNAPLSPTALHGLSAMATALQAKPALTINFYSFGIILRRTTENGGETEYAISPVQLAETLAGQVRLETGLLNGSTLYVSGEGAKKLVIEYRPPQKTALYLDGSESPVVVPLPGLIMARLTKGGDSLRYAMYAVKARPETYETLLYHAPLPNVGYSSVCWGTVKRVSDEALAGSRLDEDWKLLLGSTFTNHSVSGKSKSHPNDVRQKLIDLEKRKARKYPLSDLVPLKVTFGDLLKEKL